MPCVQYSTHQTIIFRKTSKTLLQEPLDQNIETTKPISSEDSDTIERKIQLAPGSCIRALKEARHKDEEIVKIIVSNYVHCYYLVICIVIVIYLLTFV